MSERPQIQVDINDLLADFARENAAAVQRALVAEAGMKARDRIIDQLATKVVQLEEAEAAREALAQEEPVDPVALLDETMPLPDGKADEWPLVPEGATEPSLDEKFAG